MFFLVPEFVKKERNDTTSFSVQKKRLYLFHHSLSLIVLFFCHHLKETNVYQTFHYWCLQCVIEWFFFALAIIIRWLRPPIVTVFCQVQVSARPNSSWFSTHVGKMDRKFFFIKSSYLFLHRHILFQRFKWSTCTCSQEFS